MKNFFLLKLFFLFFFYTKSSEKFLEFLLTHDPKKVFTKEDIIKKIFESFLGTDNLFLYLKKNFSDKNLIKFISLTEELIKSEKNKFYIKNNEKEEADKKITNEIIELKNFFIDELKENIFKKYNLSLENFSEENLLNSNFFNLDDSNNSIKTSINYEYKNLLNFLKSLPEEKKFKIYLINYLNNNEKIKNLTNNNLNYLNNLKYEDFKEKYNEDPLLKLITSNYSTSYGFRYFPEDFLSLKENKKYIIIDTIYRYYLEYFFIKTFLFSDEQTAFYIFFHCEISEDFNPFLNSKKTEEILKNKKLEIDLKSYNILNIFQEIKNLKK